MGLLYNPVTLGMLIFLVWAVMFLVFTKIYARWFSERFVVLYAITWPISMWLILIAIAIIYLFDNITQKDD